MGRHVDGESASKAHRRRAQRDRRSHHHEGRDRSREGQCYVQRCRWLPRSRAGPRRGSLRLSRLASSSSIAPAPNKPSSGNLLASQSSIGSSESTLLGSFSSYFTRSAVFSTSSTRANEGMGQSAGSQSGCRPTTSHRRSIRCKSPHIARKAASLGLKEVKFMSDGTSLRFGPKKYPKRIRPLFRVLAINPAAYPPPYSGIAIQSPDEYGSFLGILFLRKFNVRQKR